MLSRRCPTGYLGLSCERCDAQFKRVAQGPYLGTCSGCNCHGHSSSCDPVFGYCLVRTPWLRTPGGLAGGRVVLGGAVQELGHCLGLWTGRVLSVQLAHGGLHPSLALPPPGTGWGVSMPRPAGLGPCLSATAMPVPLLLPRTASTTRRGPNATSANPASSEMPPGAHPRPAGPAPAPTLSLDAGEPLPWHPLGTGHPLGTAGAGVTVSATCSAGSRTRASWTRTGRPRATPALPATPGGAARGECQGCRPWGGSVPGMGREAHGDASDPSAPCPLPAGARRPMKATPSGQAGSAPESVSAAANGGVRLPGKAEGPCCEGRPPIRPSVH